MNKTKEKGAKTHVGVTEIQIDDLDRGIVDELKKDCRQSWRDLARKMRVSPVTIMNRVKTLEKNGVLTGYSARLDYQKMGFELLGIMGINLPGKFYDRVVNEVIQMPEIESVYATAGDYDMIVVFRAKNRDDFYKIVQKIYRIEEVRTKTHFAVALKENYFPTGAVQPF